jgi:hypothetical protein
LKTIARAMMVIVSSWLTGSSGPNIRSAGGTIHDW